MRPRVFTDEERKIKIHQQNLKQKVRRNPNHEFFGLDKETIYMMLNNVLIKEGKILYFD